MKRLLLFLFLALAPAAEARIYIPIDQPSDKKLPIAITDLHVEGFSSGIAAEIKTVIQKDLENSGYFQFIPEEAFLETADQNNLDTAEINFDLWTVIGAQSLIKGSVAKEGNTLVTELKLFDPHLKRMIFGKVYRSSKQHRRYMAHRFADDVMEALTGIQGPFNSKITYTQKTRRGKTIMVADYDGDNTARITQTNTLSLGSKFSPDGSKVAFTSYASGRPEIYLAELGGSVKQLTRNRQTNLTPSFTPDGRAIIFTSSVREDPDLWLIDLNGRLLKQLTNETGVDISPVYTQDGSRLFFASERAGNLHLYSMASGTGNLQRLTFVGKFNDTPAVSPDGEKIAFCSLDHALGAFDIFVMHTDGSFIQRLTRKEGNNTHPAWSPDGRFLIFASTRDGDEALYMTRFDGAHPVRLTDGAASLPWWGPRLQ